MKNLKAHLCWVLGGSVATCFLPMLPINENTAKKKLMPGAFVKEDVGGKMRGASRTAVKMH